MISPRSPSTPLAESSAVTTRARAGSQARVTYLTAPSKSAAVRATARSKAASTAASDWSSFHCFQLFFFSFPPPPSFFPPEVFEDLPSEQNVFFFFVCVAPHETLLSLLSLFSLSSSLNDKTI